MRIQMFGVYGACVYGCSIAFNPERTVDESELYKLRLDLTSRGPGPYLSGTGASTGQKQLCRHACMHA